MRTIIHSDYLPFFTPAFAHESEELEAVRAIRDGAWVPVSSTFGDTDGFVSPAFLEVCEDAAMAHEKDAAAWNDERADLGAEADGLRTILDKAKDVILRVPDDADAATMDAALIDVLAILEG